MKNQFKNEFKIDDPISLILRSGIEINGYIIAIEESFFKLRSEFYEYTIDYSAVIAWKKLLLEEQKSKILNLDSKNFENIENINEKKSTEKEVPNNNKSFIREIDRSNESLGKEDKEKSEDVNISFRTPDQKEYESVPWTEQGVPNIDLFKGRNEIIEKLIKHYVSSISRKKTYILYGLTRTGKSTIIEYLSKNLEGKNIKSADKDYKIVPFIWNFGDAAANTKAEDMWNYLVESCMIKKLRTLKSKKIITYNKIDALINKLTTTGKYRFASFRRLITELRLDNLYPIILIDEFTYYMTLHKSGQLDASFLSVIRDMTMKGIISFLFAGTYDLKDLIKNPDYGITGQFSNTIDYEVTTISESAAVELINVWNDKLTFTQDAIEYILLLSNRIPYFIQIICKNAGFYAIERSLKIIDIEHLKEVVDILVGERNTLEESFVESLSDGVFMNNQFDPRADKSLNALISTLCYFSKNDIKPKGVKISDIFELWDTNKLLGLNVKITEALEDLKTKGIVMELQDNEYRLSVDLFRRWWYLRHSDIKYELNFLEERT